MSTTNRASLLNKTHKVLKRTYKHTPVKGDQVVLDTLLLAACLENAKHDSGQQAFEILRNAFFDSPLE